VNESLLLHAGRENTAPARCIGLSLSTGESKPSQNCGTAVMLRRYAAAKRGCRRMLLEAKDVTRVFGTRAAVDRVSFSVERPGFIGIIGRSGAGKSTFLRVMNRLTDATSGSLRFEGQDVLALGGSARRAWQSHCAMIFQQFNLVPRLDVVSNVLHGILNRRSTLATIFNVWPKADIERALAILDRLGIVEQATKRAEALSGGQQQRVAIARALMQDPKVILADEPIASLDPMNAQVVMDTLRRIHDEDGRLVIANLHTLDTARRYCDRVIGMRDGRIVFDGRPEQLTTGAARDIYGADASFNESATSTALPTDTAADAAYAKAMAQA
jgi:phosphonate transport system ATP-binding protein